MQLSNSQDVNWWTGVEWITFDLLWCFYQLFGLSFWRHPFTAEDPLVSKWWNAKFLQIFYDEEKKLIYTMDGLMVSRSSGKFRFLGEQFFKVPLLCLFEYYLSCTASCHAVCEKKSAKLWGQSAWYIKLLSIKKILAIT